MSAYDKITQGLSEAIDYEKGKLKGVKTDRVQIAQLPHFKGEMVQKIRLKQNMTQKTFSGVMGVSIKTVEAWEAGRNVPEGPAQRMLELMNKDETLLEKYHIVARQ